jgi:hypothetical protein
MIGLNKKAHLSFGGLVKFLLTVIPTLIKVPIAFTQAKPY